jgi:hypothetical protein
MSNTRAGVLIFICSAVAIPILACAATPGSGAKIIRVDETSEQEYCINGRTDEIFVHLRSFVAGKDRNVFKEDGSIGMVIDTTVSGDVRRQPEKINFPVAFQATVRNYGEGLVSIPIEKGILSSFALSDGDARYSQVELSFRFIKVQEDTTIGRAIKSLATVTEDYSLPAEIFGASFQMYASIASSLIDNVFTDNRNSTQDPLASIVLAFDPDGRCDNLLFEKTGTKAVVMAGEGGDEDGVVDINQMNSYCFQTELRPSFEVWFWKRAAGVCADRPAEARQLRNPHFGFYVTARPIDPEAPTRGDREAGMLDLCAAHGLTDPQLCGGIASAN